MVEPVTISIELLKLFGGLVYLLVGGDILVRGALGLAHRAGVPPLVIGLTIVAAGTSMPELMVSVFAALDGYGDIAVGNVVGSNIINVLVVLGLPVLVFPAHTDEGMVARESAFMVLVTVLFIGLCFTAPLGTVHGLALLSVLAVGLLLALRHSGGTASEEADTEFRRVLGLPTSVHMITIFVVLGIAALPIGADLTVEAAVSIAQWMGVSQAVIGVTIVAVGTSLPELSTTLIGALHRSSGVALGNVVGSNIFNVLGIMGITSLITTVPVAEQFMRYDVWVMLAVAVLMWVYACFVKVIGRVSGLVFIGLYALYIFGLF